MHLIVSFFKNNLFFIFQRSSDCFGAKLRYFIPDRFIQERGVVRLVNVRNSRECEVATLKLGTTSTFVTSINCTTTISRVTGKPTDSR